MEENKQTPTQQPLPAWAYMIAFFALLGIVAGFLVLFNYLGSAIGGDPATLYFMLVILGLAAAVATTGAMRSIATFSGGVKNNRIQLGGPIVAAALVVAGGYYFLNRSSSNTDTKKDNTEIKDGSSSTTPKPTKTLPFIDNDGVEITFKSENLEEAKVYIDDEYIGCATPCKKKLRANGAYIVYTKIGKLKSAEQPLRVTEDMEVKEKEVVLGDYKETNF